MSKARRVCVGMASMLFASAALAAPGKGGYHVIDRIPGPDGGWDYASFDTDGGRVFIARVDSVMSIDVSSRKVNAKLTAAAGAHQALPINGGKEVLITNGRTNTVTIVDAVTGVLVATIQTGDKPDAASLDPVTGLALVMDHGGGDVVLIDLKEHKKVGSIDVGGTLEAAAVDGSGKAYVNIEDKSQVAVLDVKARKVLARYDLPGCEGPTGIAYVPDQQLLIEACDGSTVAVRANTGRVVSVVKIGPGADGVAYDGARGLAFVPSGKAGTLNVLAIKNGTMRLVETIPTQASARTLALDPQSGRVYLPAAMTVPPPPGQRRPEIVPGSYVTLVVGR